MRDVAKPGFPQELSKPYATNRNEVFNIWLNKSQDLQAVADVYMERKIEQELKNTTAAKGKKKRDLEKMLPAEKAAELIARRLKSGGYYPDPDFPDDPEEYFYYVHEGREVSQTSRQIDTMGMRASGSVDAATAQQMVSDGGLFASDRFVSASGSSAVSLQLLLDGGSAKAAPKPKPKPKPKANPPTDPLQPVDIKTRAVEGAQDILREATEARKLALQCANHTFGQQIHDELMAHAAYLEGKFQVLSKESLKAKADEDMLENLFAELDDKTEWYRVAHKAASSMASAAQPPKKKQKKNKDNKGNAAEG